MDLTALALLAATPALVTKEPRVPNEHDAARVKKAKAKRRRQRAKRKQSWTGKRDKDCAILKRVAENARKPLEKVEAPALVLIFNSRPNGSNSKGKSFRNPGKTAVRMDRARRKAASKKERQLIAALRARVAAREQLARTA